MLSLRVVPGAWQRPFQPEVGGLVDAPARRVVRGGHAVLAVGVVDNQQAGRRAIVKNSWGLEWGVSGYGFLTERYLDAYLKRAFLLERA
jgi:C1A family cysteine protease